MQLFEQRKHKRYKAPEAAILVEDNMVFRILNISEGGLRFRCQEKESLPSTWSTAVFLGPSSVHIKDVLLQLIWEKPDNKPSFLSMPTKEVGVRFKALSPIVKDQMGDLLRETVLSEA